MKILDEAQRILELAHYSTVDGSTPDTFYFEDVSLFGFVWAASSVNEILRQWEERQGNFLRERDQQLRKSKEKSWNAYAIFLTEAEANTAESEQLMRLEENFTGTRKIARADLRTNDRIVRALFPLIQIQSLVQLREDDAITRLRDRLTPLGRNAVDVLLGSEDAIATAETLLRSYENPSH